MSTGARARTRLLVAAGALLIAGAFAPASTVALPGERAPQVVKRWGCKYIAGRPSNELDGEGDRYLFFGMRAQCERTNTYKKLVIQLLRVRYDGPDQVISSRGFAPMTNDHFLEGSDTGCHPSWEKVPARIYTRALIRKKGARKRVVIASPNLGKATTRGGRADRTCPLR